MNVVPKAAGEIKTVVETAKTGGVGEYDQIEETVAPVALEQMASWINARFGRK